ncbi:MAG: hypothetical protein A3E32_02655 [Candidatus Zambryskibacteria bacterium RIFCSPHIGHO2_12_FULL_38_37]|uniref:Uncharacterized protein n=2 Tax=Candidatus Zambryskiibacteriota TaxID=1817925 RepID=A0A1G2UT99_9BACT|nr:MAG: hypothetical protein A3E32_02655 [Candidatus Zambryskibacteria bacterium RIFCSPHIGHO2_12_FULL_38_37]OHB12617.1 MAG: hypothetical protein A2Y49_01180 [Candidatus Zambryskibacteria bacterium RIFCSPLOWO2_12_39_8]
MINKKITLLISGVISILLLSINYLGTYETCYFSGICAEILATILRTLYIFIPLSILSLLTYNMADQVYRIWFKFIRIWIPLTIFLVVLSPKYSNSLIPIEKGSVSFVFSVLFLLISLIIIITKSLSSKK